MPVARSASKRGRSPGHGELKCVAGRLALRQAEHIDTLMRPEYRRPYEVRGSQNE